MGYTFSLKKKRKDYVRPHLLIFIVQDPQLQYIGDDLQSDLCGLTTEAFKYSTALVYIKKSKYEANSHPFSYLTFLTIFALSRMF